MWKENPAEQLVLSVTCSRLVFKHWHLNVLRRYLTRIKACLISVSNNAITETSFFGSSLAPRIFTTRISMLYARKKVGRIQSVGGVGRSVIYRDGSIVFVRSHGRGDDSSPENHSETSSVRKFHSGEP